LEWLADRFNIQELEDWYYVSFHQVVQLKGSMPLLSYQGFVGILADVFPEHNWKTATARNKGQTILLKAVQQLFPLSVDDIQTNYKHPNLSFSGSNSNMELDVYIAPLSLAFEYQGNALSVSFTPIGEQHYKWHFVYGSPEEQQKRDQEKIAACLKAGIRLIQVPYWWDTQLESLERLLRKQESSN
jgi:hypothetical protein